MHVLITGASSGIGEAIARAFAQKGTTLTVVARREDRLTALQKEFAGKATIAVEKRDLSNPDTVKGLVAAAEAKNGPLDVVINNAGVQMVAAFASAPVDEARRMVDLNLTSAMILAHEAIGAMLPRRHGTIVNVASVAAFVSPPGMAAYGASKAALGMFSEVLAAELKGSGLHVLTVYPGPVRTAMGDAGEEAYEPSWATRNQVWGKPEVLAGLVVDAIAHEKGRVVYPSSYAPVRYIAALAQAFTERFTPPLKSKP